MVVLAVFEELGMGMSYKSALWVEAFIRVCGDVFPEAARVCLALVGFQYEGPHGVLVAADEAAGASKPALDRLKASATLSAPLERFGIAPLEPNRLLVVIAPLLRAWVCLVWLAAGPH